MMIRLKFFDKNVTFFSQHAKDAPLLIDFLTRILCQPFVRFISVLFMQLFAFFFSFKSTLKTFFWQNLQICKYLVFLCQVNSVHSGELQEFPRESLKESGVPLLEIRQHLQQGTNICNCIFFLSGTRDAQVCQKSLEFFCFTLATNFNYYSFQGDILTLSFFSVLFLFLVFITNILSS